MFEYHGWFSSTEEANTEEIERRLKEINNPYPASAGYVNGSLHISFSGNPNRENKYIESIIDYLLNLKLKLYGVIYINDANSLEFDRFKVIKVINDKKHVHEDRNFTIEESKSIFK